MKVRELIGELFKHDPDKELRFGHKWSYDKIDYIKVHEIEELLVLEIETEYYEDAP